MNAAAAGDTIQVCAGTFAEQVMVTKSVKLVGAGSAQTTIVLPRPVTGTQDVVTVDGTGGGVDVEISGFTIKGLAPTGECAPAGTTYLLSGIYVRNGANANIHDNVITGMRGDPLDGCQKGSGIRVGRAATPTSGTATITNNTISDYQKTGIIVDNAGSAATITGNTITGVGPTNVVAQNGMQISRGAVATVSGNRVSGNAYTGSGVHVDRAAALRLARQGGRLRQHVQRERRRHLGRAGAAPPGEATAVRTNTISGGEFGISVTGPTTAVLIEENKITGASDTGIDVGVERGREPPSRQRGERRRPEHGRRVRLPRPFCRSPLQRHRQHLDRQHRRGRAPGRDLLAEVCAAGAPRSEVEPPQVIVLPPSPPDGYLVQPPEPAGPVAEAKADEVIAKMRDKQLSSCTIELRARGQQNLVVARGFARAPAGGRGQMVIKLDVQPKGEQLLDRSFGGVLVNVHAICRTATGETVNGVKGARAVLAIERVVTTPGSWLPDLAVLTPVGESFVAGLARKLVAIEGIRCDGYTATSGQPCRPDGALTAAGAARLRAAKAGRPLQGDRADRPAWNREPDRLERHRDGTGGEPPRRHHVRAPPRRAEEQRPRLTPFSSAAATSRSARPGSRLGGTGSQVGFKGTLCD